MKVLVLVLTASIVIYSCSPYPVIKEIEPNEISSPQIIDYNCVIEGKASQNDSDYYKFYITNNIISLHLFAHTSMSLSLLDSRGKTLDVAGRGKCLTNKKAKCESSFLNYVLDNAPYYLLVETDNTNYEKYRLTFIFTNSLQEGFEEEINDSFEYANTLTPTSPVLGLFSPAINIKDGVVQEEKDFFVFENPFNETLSFSVSLSGVDSVDSSLEIYNHKKEIIGMADEFSVGEGEEVRDYTFLSGFKYFVAVVNKNAVENTKTSYSLTLETKDFCRTNENEPNDSYENAKDTEFGLYYNGLVYGNDTDIFTMSVPEEDGANIRIILQSSKGDLGFVVLSTNYESIVKREEGVDEDILANYPLEKGIYYIKVYSKEKSISKYSLYIQSMAGMGWEKEPNNYPLTNILYGGQQEIRGYIGEEGDIDSFSLVGKKPMIYMFEVLPPEGLNIKLYLYNSRNEVVGQSDRRGVGRSEAISRYIEEYPIRIDIEADGFNVKHNYLFNVYAKEKTSYEAEVTN